MMYMKSTFICIRKCVRKVICRTRVYSVSTNSTREGDGGKLGASANSSMNSKGLKKLALGAAGVILVAGLTMAVISRRKGNASGLRKIEPLSPQQELLLASDEVEQVGSEDIGAGPDEAYQSDVFVDVPATVIQESTLEPEHNPVIVNLDNPSVSDSDTTNRSPDHQEGISISREVENSKLPLDISSGLGGVLALSETFSVYSQYSQYSQWLHSASKDLSRKSSSKLYPAMYVENATENELAMEREKIDAVEKMAPEARLESERFRAAREEENNAMMRGWASVESESKKHAIVSLQYELEVERKALSMARAWAEGEAEFARQQGKAVKEAIDRLEKDVIKVIADSDLREDVSARVASVSAGKQSIVDETVSSAESWVDKLREMAGKMRGKSMAVIDTTISKMTSLVSSLKERTAKELQGVAVSKASESVQGSQQSATGYSSFLTESPKRIAGDWREGVEKITQKFKA